MYQLAFLKLSFAEINALGDMQPITISSAHIAQDQTTGIGIYLNKSQIKKLSSGKPFELKMTKAQIKYNMKHGAGIGDFFKKIWNGIKKVGEFVAPVVKPAISAALPVLTQGATAALNGLAPGLGTVAAGPLQTLTGLAQDKLNGNGVMSLSTKANGVMSPSTKANGIGEWFKKYHTGGINRAFTYGGIPPIMSYGGRDLEPIDLPKGAIPATTSSENTTSGGSIKRRGRKARQIGNLTTQIAPSLFQGKTISNIGEMVQPVLTTPAKVSSYVPTVLAEQMQYARQTEGMTKQSGSGLMPPGASYSY